MDIADKMDNLAEMNLQDMRNRVEEILELLAEVEEQLEDETLPHSDQELLEQMWEGLNYRIEVLQEAIEMAEDYDDYDDGSNSDSGSESETESEWGGDAETPPRSHTVRVVRISSGVYMMQSELDALNSLSDERVSADYYEPDFGVYYDAGDEV